MDNDTLIIYMDQHPMIIGRIVRTPDGVRSVACKEVAIKVRIGDGGSDHGTALLDRKGRTHVAIPRSDVNAVGRGGCCFVVRKAPWEGVEDHPVPHEAGHVRLIHIDPQSDLVVVLIIWRADGVFLVGEGFIPLEELGVIMDYVIDVCLAPFQSLTDALIELYGLFR